MSLARCPVEGCGKVISTRFPLHECRSPKKIKARRLSVIAAWINANVRGLVATVEATEYNTDRKIGRLRHPGKGRKGNRIIVRKVGSNERLLDHNSAETYRTNAEVERWLSDYLKKNA